MPRYHVSQDGVSRVCKAATADSCTAVGVDGESAPHGEFSSADEARRFAESVLEKSSLGDGLDGSSREKAAVAMVGGFPEMEGWHKVSDSENSHILGPRGETLTPTADGEWLIVASDGERVGVYDDLSEGVEALDYYEYLEGYGEDGAYRSQYETSSSTVAVQPETPDNGSSPQSGSQATAPKRNPVKPAYLADSLRSSLVEYQSPHRTEERRRQIEEFWNANSISDSESAQARATEIQAQVDRDHSNRIDAIGQDREADARRFAETSEELAKMDAALDLGSRIQPDYMQTSEENRLLARSLEG